MAKKTYNSSSTPSSKWSQKANSMVGNPGAQGSVTFGSSYKDNTNTMKGKLDLPQTIANPKKKSPVRTNGNAPGNVKVSFGGKGVKQPKPAKNVVGFRTSD